MIIRADLRSQQESYNLPHCSIDKVVELSPAEYTEFTLNPLSAYDFIHDFNQEKHPERVGIRSCVLVLSEAGKDGVLIDPQGYNYAHNTAYLPNARLLIQQEQYPSLTAHVDEMRRLTEKYVQKALDCQIDCQYRINLSEARNLCRQSGFTDELFIEMLSERQEFEYVEQTEDDCFVTIAEPYLRQEDERNLRKLTPKEVEVMCAKHILWLNDAGGEQADFSNCLLKDLDLSRRHLNNAVFGGAKFTNTRLCGAELCFAVLNNAKLLF